MLVYNIQSMYLNYVMEPNTFRTLFAQFFISCSVFNLTCRTVVVWSCCEWEETHYFSLKMRTIEFTHLFTSTFNAFLMLKTGELQIPDECIQPNKCSSKKLVFQSFLHNITTSITNFWIEYQYCSFEYWSMPAKIPDISIRRSYLFLTQNRNCIKLFKCSIVTLI